jgi:hypothetical protein
MLPLAGRRTRITLQNHARDGAQQLEYQVTADEARAARDENRAAQSSRT